MKKTPVAVSSTLIFGTLLISAISTKAASLSDLGAVFDTIQGYIQTTSEIVAGMVPTDAETAAGVKAVSDPSFYGISGVQGVPFNPSYDSGQITFDRNGENAIVAKFVENQTNKIRLSSEYQKVAELGTFQNATVKVAKASKKLNEDYQAKLSKDIATTRKKSLDTIKAQPIGTCDSSLCAENASNVLSSQQINMQNAAIELAIVNNAYSKISNDQQAILIKQEQDRKADDVVSRRASSVTAGTSLQNRFNADLLFRTAFGQ
jgi:hypothetical protein